MPRERRSKYANDAKDTAGIASQVESLSSSLAQNATKIEEKSSQVSDLFANNLVDTSKITLGSYIQSGGTIGTLASAGYTDFVKVNAGDLYYFYNLNNADATFSPCGCFYKADKTFLSDITAVPTEKTKYVLAPTNAAYVRFNVGSNKLSSVYLKRGIKSKWADKRMNVLGDSITYGYGLTDTVNENFGALIKQKLAMKDSFNYGSSGTRIGKITDGDFSFTQRYSAMYANPDIVLVLGGTNDYGHSAANNGSFVPFGSFTDRTDTTFYGALHVLYKGLIEKYVGKTIVILTPLHRNALAGQTGDDYVANPSTSKNLLDYVKAIREVAEYYGLPVLDLFRDFYLNPNITAIKTAYMPDGLHPNAAGQQLLADKVMNFMEKL
jgi:lysophospholipase L1-like esterase